MHIRVGRQNITIAIRYSPRCNDTLDVIASRGHQFIERAVVIIDRTFDYSGTEHENLADACREIAEEFVHIHKT